MSSEERILVWASPRDARLTCSFLRDAGLGSQVCDSLEAFREESRVGVGVLIVAGEVLAADVVAQLQVLLAAQPAWSDLPIIVVVGSDRVVEHRTFDALGNVSLIQRPLALDTLRTTVSAALRARRRQYQVRALLEQKDETDRRKNEFLAMLAHELRNPLAPLRTGLHLLQLHPNAEVVARTHATMERQIVNLTRLIDDLLDVSRISRRKIVLKKRVLDARESVRQVADTLRHLASEKALHISIDLPDTSLLIEADAVRVEQMLGNLLSNAIKYTPPNGDIQLSARREDAFVVISVKDTGVGIPPAQLEHVFELFAQTDRPLDRSQGGLGLGLTIVRQLAELHGGTAQLFSRGPGSGTEALVRLPAAIRVSDAPDARTRQASRSSGRRVLVIEDNADVAEMLAMYLQQVGHDVIVATDGRAGLESALRHHPDVIVCDIGLPGLNGFDIAMRLRSEAGFNGCLLIAVTGYGDVADRERTRKAGFAYHLTKPADPSRVAELIATRAAG